MKKRCVRCGKEKDKSEFYRQKDTGDGYGSWCKECHRIYQHTPAVKETRRKWKENPQGRQKICAAQRRYENSEKGKKRHKRRRRDKTKIQATSKVNEAVKRGRIPHISAHICVDCERQAEVYHHEDYNYPLEITPLCKRCHSKRHQTE